MKTLLAPSSGWGELKPTVVTVIDGLEDGVEEAEPEEQIAHRAGQEDEGQGTEPDPHAPERITRSLHSPSLSWPAVRSFRAEDSGGRSWSAVPEPSAGRRRSALVPVPRCAQMAPRSTPPARRPASRTFGHDAWRTDSSVVRHELQDHPPPGGRHSIPRTAGTAPGLRCTPSPRTAWTKEGSPARDRRPTVRRSRGPRPGRPPGSVRSRCTGEDR